MLSYNQIKNPQTDRYIKIYGKTFNDLIKYQGYTEKELLSLATKNVILPSHQNTYELTGVDDADVYILSQLDDENLVNVCQTNKRISKLCKNNKILNNRIERYLFQLDEQLKIMKYRIARAIRAEDNKQGSTLQYIKKYLECNYNINPKDPLINKTIKMLTSLKSGERLIVNPHHKGHYKISKELRNNCFY